MSDFYSFNIQYDSQNRTNWCWCACFSWIIKALNIKSNYRDQWQILYYHSKFIKNEIKLQLHENNIKTNNAFNYQIDTFTNDVNELIEQNLLLKYEEINILKYEDRRYEKLKDVLSFNNIKHLLKQNNAPIIISSYTHMVLISGFGTNECGDFILVSDPERGEYFMKASNFISRFKNEIFKIWILENKDGSGGNLIKDNFIEKIKEETKTLSDIIVQKEHFDANPFSLLNFTNKINHLLLNFDDNKISNLNEQIFNTIDNNFKNPILCDIIFQKNEISNIRILTKVLEEYFKSTNQKFDLNEFEIKNKNESFTLMAEQNTDILYGILNNKKMNFREALLSIKQNQY